VQVDPVAAHADGVLITGDALGPGGRQCNVVLGDGGHGSDAAGLADVGRLGLAAVCERWRDRDRAAAIYQRVLQSGHRGAGPLAAVQLGLVYERRWRRGDAARARALFQLAIDSGHAQAAPLAEVHLRGLNRRTRRGMPRAPPEATASQTEREQDEMGSGP
jgi:hypothetical protein